MERTHQGGCHCGRVRFEVTADITEVTDCNCSICTRKGFLHLIVELSQLRLTRGGDALTSYRFNTGVARHTFCATCGIHPFYTPRSHPDKVDVNARCIEALDLSSVKITPFDGRNWA
jgi:hypothetical protein